GEKGGIFIEEDGITRQIYEYDLFPTELAYDEQLGYETVRMRHYLPQEGWKEFVLRSSLLARPVDFEVALRDQHVQPLIRNKITMFADAYMRKLRAETKMRKLFMTQGWKEGDTEFVLGTRLYRVGEVVTAGHSSGATGFVRHFRPQGTLEEWREPTFALGLPGMEPHAFMLLLAFAAPLLKLANRHGFTVCALGEKGVGKSTMGNWLASVYGHPEATWGAADDSVNARYERLGAYGALPMYFDEASTIEPDELRRLVYSVAAGKSRDTLKTDRTLRPGPTWETILITSSNDSLQAKLRLSKRNAEAEAARLFEFRMPRVRAFGEVANVIMPHLRANYGVAGPRYIQHVVNNLARVKSEANQRVLDSHRTLGIAPEDRFWAQAAALSIYGGELAREAGVIDFDPNCIRPWLIGELYRMKGNVVDNRTDAVAVLSQYLNEHVGERLVVTDLNRGLSVSDQKPTRGMLSQRYEPDKKLIWVDREHVRRWMDKHHFGADGIRDDLIKAGVLLADNAACSLGKGTYYAGGAVKCWKIRADHPGLDIATDEA
ncbi:MAG: DUF927 domain-containing protein, partial [Burkholderiales bacterium]|nr:DUF927 domain-containing protein [Burkholderiales bacterium]